MDTSQRNRRVVTKGSLPADRRRVEIKLGPSKDVPVDYASQLLVNFTGNEFVVTVLQVVPAPWQKEGELPKAIDAKVLARYAFAPQLWAATVTSCHAQITKLAEQGLLTVEMEPNVDNEAKA